MNNKISFVFNDLEGWCVEVQPHGKGYFGWIYNGSYSYDYVEGTLDDCISQSREIIESVVKVIPKHLINSKEAVTIIKNDGNFGEPIFHVLIKTNGRACIRIFKMNSDVTQDYSNISKYINERNNEGQ